MQEGLDGIISGLYININNMEGILIFGRIIVGGYFIMSGINHFTGLAGMTGYAQSKGVPMAKWGVILSGILLFLGGLGILLGAYVVWSIALLIVALLPITFMIHSFWKIEDPMAKMGDRVNFMKNMGLIGLLLIIAATYTADWMMALNWVM